MAATKFHKKTENRRQNVCGFHGVSSVGRGWGVGRLNKCVGWSSRGDCYTKVSGGFTSAQQQFRLASDWKLFVKP